MDEADFVIVGAGAAGPLIAAKLSENPVLRIVLIEAGEENTSEVGRMQGAFMQLWGGKEDWGYKTQADEGLGGRQLPEPRGKVIGGSTAINVGAWLRGVPADYDGWAESVGAAWGWDAALTTFRALEDTDRGPSKLRGVGGPIAMQNLPTVSRLADQLVAAIGEAGFGPSGDANGPTPYVADRYQTIFPERRRRTPADVFLSKEVRNRPNLRILTKSLTTSLRIEDGRATGVKYSSGLLQHSITARREVILCAGAINTPQLLMLSGIGPAEHLKKLKIDVLADRPGVGANLQDHLSVPISVVAPKGVIGSVLEQPDEAAIARWQEGRDGPAAWWPSNTVTFLALVEGAPPDFELLLSYNPEFGQGGMFTDVKPGDGRSGFGIEVNLLQPGSRGRIELASKDAFEKPLIYKNFLSHPVDLPKYVAGIRMAARIANAPILAEYRGEISPPPDATDAQIEKHIRENAISVFHPVGTAKMGRRDDPLAVVDQELKVIGVDGLRVADASVFPSITRGHTMAPTLFVAARAAEMIARDADAAKNALCS